MRRWWYRWWPRAAAMVLVAALAWDARGLWRAWSFNAALAHPLPAAQVQGRGGPSWWLFAQAWGAQQRGAPQEALALYKDSAGDPALAVAAHYNSGNIHLREALELARQGGLQQAPQPVELAKQQYREALRRDPGHWPAKYNLERALWLAPEGQDEGAGAPPQHSERAVTTMRGFSIGLP